MPRIYSHCSPSEAGAMSQTMLLTKRLTAFLSQNTTPALPTLILISPTGKLLSSSSPLPASQLRSQATTACTLWNLYTPLQSDSNDVLSTALIPPESSSGPLSHRGGSSIPTTAATADSDRVSITMQLSEGIMVIRALKCGLLFVAVGVSPTSPYSSAHTLHTQTQHISTSSLGSLPGVTSTLPSDGHGTLIVGNHGDREGYKDTTGLSPGHAGSGAPSESGSMGSTNRRAQASIMVVKRQAEELGNWLEKSLDGFVLSSADSR